jgi:hypothetical protein
MDNPSSSSSGLYKRQATSSVEEGRAPANHSNNTTEMEIEAEGCENSSGSSGVSLLSAPDGSPMDAASQSSSISSSNNSSENLSCFVYGHIAWSVLFLVAGSSIVPLFAAVEDESWRTYNIPLQKTAAGDIILDFQLDKPLVDPPTVPCKYACMHL